MLKRRRYVAYLAIFCMVTLLLGGAFFLAPPAQHTAAASNPIQQENSLPGTPGWNDFSADLQPDTISGFGSQISVNHGGSIDFYVTTTAPSFTIDIFRTGYYQGIGARLITSLGSFPGLHQAIPQPDRVTGIIACTNWTKTTTLQIPSTWVTGVYLAKLTSSTGNSSFIFFVVRNDGGHEDLVFQTSVTTYQAYNTWGGTSLYNNLTNGSVFSGPHATKVSFDRPFNPGDSNGAGHYFFYEYKFVYWLESQGYDVTYTTNIDTDSNVNPLTNHKGFLSVGHDEYWSRGARTNLQNAINAGVNVAFFSANTMYWQIRFENSSKGVPYRVEVGYKDFATDTTPPGPDPQWNVNNSIVTTLWRDPVVNQPENGIIGVMYEQQVDANYAYVVQNASSWVYANTGFVNGSSVPGIVGYEYDKVYNNGFSPAGLTVLSNSPVHGCCGGFSSFANSTIYTAASGARVFASGTIQWSWGLANVQGNTFADPRIQQTTANILNNFIVGPTPSISLSQSSVNFGAALVGNTTAATAITVTSNGTADLTISQIGIAGTNAADFSQTNNCPATLTISSICTINVKFSPTASGTRTANLTITDNAQGSPQALALTGVGQTTPAPLVSLSPASLTYTNQNVGTTSPAQTITLTNYGTAALSITGIATSGANAGDFTQTNTCPASLAANSSCTINVQFSPTGSGTRTTNLAITDNAQGSPQTAALSGNGISPTIYFTDGFESGNFSLWTLPSSDSTGQSTIQSTVVNGGASAAAFTNTSGQYVYRYTALPGGPQSQTFTRFYFRLASLTNGSILALARNANNGNTWEIDYNSRKGLDIYFWTSTGAVYSIFSPSNGLLANIWYSVEVQFTQTTSGVGQVWLNGTSVGTVTADFSNVNPFARLLLFNGAPTTFYFDDVQIANVYNGPVAPAPVANLNPTSLSFGNLAVGTTSVAQTITVANRGTAPMNISSITIIGANASDFSDPSLDKECPNTLPVNATCTIDISFTPSAVGNRTATLSISDNAQNSPQTVALSGSGAVSGPGASVNPTSLNFGNQAVGTSGTPLSVTFTNNGTAATTISGITVTGANASEFTQTNTCPVSPATLAPNATCTISVTFTPGANGSRSATLNIADNSAAGSPQTVALSGTGFTANIYFSDSFEGGNFNQWTISSADSTGQATIQHTVVHTGSSAVAFTNASGQYVYLYTALPGGPQSQTYTRIAFQLSSLTNGNILAVARNANGGNTWEIDYDAGRQALDLYFWTSSGSVYQLLAPTNSLTANTWYTIEVQFTQTTNGIAQAWLNGTSVGSVNADFSNANPFARLMLTNLTAGTVYFDDIEVADSYI